LFIKLQIIKAKYNNIKEISESGLAKVYPAAWIDGIIKYYKNSDKSWQKIYIQYA
jgi:hypothetical protein